jgi:hypothetical protein
MIKSAFVGLFIFSSAFANPSVQCWGNNAQGQTTVPTDLKMNAMPIKPVEVRTARGATCALDQTGKVTCWGIFIPGLSDLQALSGVKSFGISSGGSCAIAANRVKCFSAVQDSVFETPPTFKNPKAISVGQTFACAEDDNGLQCWGGQTNATQVPTLKNPKKFQTSFETTCALDETGLQCWGDGDFGIETVPPLNKPEDFFMGEGYACAIDSKGLQCWGNPVTGGQDAGITLPPIPTITGTTASTQFIAGQTHVCGLDSSGVHCWGDNTLGQLRVPALSHPTKIFGDAVGSQTCAVDDSGLVCWGEDQVGQSSLSAVNSLSAGLNSTCLSVQGKLECWGGKSQAVLTVLPVTDAYQVSLGSNFACAMDVSDSATNACWGDNVSLLPLSPTLPTLDYTQGDQLNSTPTLVSAGYDHACSYAGISDGNTSVTCFGNNDFGQETVPANFNSTGNAGGNHTCGIDVVLGLLCWGENANGESTPPKTLKNPRQVSAGFYHTCALDDNGVSCWGRSSEGQTNVPKLVNPRLVQAGGYHTCALDDNGVSCWGDNSFGQSTVPASLVMPNQGRKISALSSGQFHNCVATQ